MSERSEKISRLQKDPKFHAAYLLAKLNVNIASQTRALRLRRKMTQKDLESTSGMRQSRISAIETPGATNPSIDTLARLAAAFKVGLIVEFAPMSEVVQWENRFNQDTFDVTEIEKDEEFLNPSDKESETGSTGLLQSVPSENYPASITVAAFANFACGGEGQTVSKEMIYGKSREKTKKRPIPTSGDTRQGVSV